MSSSMQSPSHTRGLPHPTFESYDLARSARSRVSYRKEDDLFDTLFPQPPPRSRVQAERLARPSLPSLKASLQVDSADSSQSTSQLLSSSNSIESVNSLSSYPSSTSSLSLLHSIHPYKQASTDSSIDYYSPAVSDVNSAETDHSVSSSHAHSQSSEIDANEQGGPLTPLTPNGASQAWRPKELNLLRKRHATGPAEPSLPAYQATPSWNAPSSISGDRNALLIGLGLGGVGLHPAPATSSVPTNLPAEKLMHSKQGRAFLRSKSPQLGTSASWARDANVNAPGGTSQGPKQLLLVSSGGPPAVRRFPGRRPSEGLHEAFTFPAPASEASSRCTTPQMRSTIPVMPSGPAFVDARAPSPDVTSLLANAERQAGLSAEQFLAQIASTPEYQASQYLEAAGSSSAWPSDFERIPTGRAMPNQESPKPPLSAVSMVAVDHGDDRNLADDHPTVDSVETGSSATASPGLSVLAAKAPGFSSTQRSRAASLSKRKAPPTPLVLTSSPATSNSDTLPGSAGGRRRRSLTATISQRSPLSAPHSSHSSTGEASASKTPTSAASESFGGPQDSASDYSEPLRTAFYDFDTDEDSDEQDTASKPSSTSNNSPTAEVPLSASTTDPTPSRTSAASLARPESGASRERITYDSPESRHSALSIRVSSLRSHGQNRGSADSEPATAFEFADLETKSHNEGLSLQTMMGFLQRQNSQRASKLSHNHGADSDSDEQARSSPTEPTMEQETGPKTEALADSAVAPLSPPTKVDERANITPTVSAASGVPSFNISIFDPNASTEAKATPSLRISVDPKNGAQRDESGIVPASPVSGMARPRKQSMVPAPPSFAIRDASRDEQQPGASSTLLPAVTDSPEARPVFARADSNEATGNSRWSSGSESDGESALSTKGGRKSLSKGRKSFSTSRKNSVAIARELITGPIVTKDVLPDVGRRQSKRSSKTRLSAQGVAAQTLPIPSKSGSKPSAASMSKRLLLNGLPSLRKKSFSNLSGASASPSTPTSAREAPGSGFVDKTEFPFPPSAASPQSSRSPPVPSLTSRPLDRDETAGLTIKTAFASTFASTSQAALPSPRMPLSAPHATSSSGSSGPLTTQQILAQARSNVWPENFIGTSVSAAGMSSPYLSAAQDTFSYSFAPSRLAPTPPYSASRAGWGSAPHTPPMPQSPRMPSAAFMEKALPSTPADASMAPTRSRSRTAEIALPPKNLRHMRQSSSNTNLDKMRKDMPADLFKPSQVEAAPTGAGPESALASSPPNASAADEEKLPTIAETGTAGVVFGTEAIEPVDAKDFGSAMPVLVDRKQAKWKKALRVRREQDRYPRRNSWSEDGLQWLAEHGTEAFDRLAAEGLPSSALVAAAGGATSRSNRIAAGGAAGGSGGGDGGGSSDESDTDDYGSSDGGGGGGGGGGFGGAGGGDGGKHPPFGRKDADDSDDDEDEESDEDAEAEALTDEDSEDNYGEVEQSTTARSARGGAMPAVPVRNASMPASKLEAEDAADSDSSDDRPLGMLVDDPKALQKALRAQERKRHFDLAAQALEGKGSSNATPSTTGHTRSTRKVQAPGQAGEAILNPNELAQRLAKVQGRRERAHAPNAALMQRSQTVARQDVGRAAERKQLADPAAVSRSKSVRATPAERYVHPGMRARTPSEAALRAKAMAQAMPQGPSPISPTLPNVAKLPDLPSNAMATVVAAQKAMAHAQANPTPAALAQAQALASSATAALNAATAQVKRTGSSPVTPSFALGEPVGHVATSPRMADGVELPGARHRADSRGAPFPVASSGAAHVAAPAAAPAHQPGMFQRLRARSVSRQQAPLTINTAAAPPMPDLPRPNTASKDSQASSSPHSAHTATFAALSQAAAHRSGRPSVDAAASHADASMQRAASHQPDTLSSSHDSGVSPSAVPGEPRQPHKVYILSRQRFTVVEVPVSARARDLALEVIERERLPMDDSKGGWVVFDCSAQLGIERPLREYEMITDVVNVRAHPKTDFFLIKRTELSPYLSIRSVPSSSPALAGYVYVQDRKKKWNKRWLELRDHGLFHAKNEKGKDETSVCQISTFDVYLVDGSAVKMPKANGFALRSQDPITMFEKPDQDYIHYFCLTDPAAHRDWVRAILNARTYILRQEKAVLFQIDSASTSQDAASGAAASGGLSRKNTSRRPNGRSPAAAPESGSGGAAGPSPPAPLIDSNAFAGPFAKGSLLADKAINDAKEALRGHVAVAPPTGAFNDLNLMDRNAVRLNEARRREEAIERQRRMKADGQPLIDLARK